MVPQGWPKKRKIGAQDLPNPVRRTKKPHSLSKNISIIVDVNKL